VKSSLDKSKTPIITAEEVADVVVKQILSGKGAQLFIPARQSIFAGLRGFPNWLQEIARISAGKTLKDVHE